MDLPSSSVFVGMDDGDLGELGESVMGSMHMQGGWGWRDVQELEVSGAGDARLGDRISLLVCRRGMALCVCPARRSS